MNSEEKITYQSFTERVAKRARVTNTEADAYLHELSKTVGDALEEGDEVKLYHFGRFHTTHFDERPGHNPQTGEPLTIPDQTRVEFEPYKALLIAVNWPFRNLRTRMLPEEKTSPRSRTYIWALILALLALALLALLVVGINLSTRMFTPAPVAAPPAEPPAQQSGSVESQPLATQPAQPAPASTETAADTPVATETPAVSDTATSAETSTPAGSAGATTTIAVESGDTLWGIAISQWQDSSWWPVLYAENRASLMGRNPELIETGGSLRIPVLEGGVTRPTDSDLKQKEEGYRIVSDDYERIGHHRAAEYRSFVNRRFGEL